MYIWYQNKSPILVPTTTHAHACTTQNKERSWFHLLTQMKWDYVTRNGSNSRFCLEFGSGHAGGVLPQQRGCREKQRVAANTPPTDKDEKTVTPSRGCRRVADQRRSLPTSFLEKKCTLGLRHHLTFKRWKWMQKVESSEKHLENILKNKKKRRKDTFLVVLMTNDKIIVQLKKLK